jgi:hypothetical protein
LQLSPERFATCSYGGGMSKARPKPESNVVESGVSLKWLQAIENRAEKN